MATTRQAALTSAVRLEVVTIAWMAVEALIAIGAGIAARSVLLTAFGADSVIELLSGVVLFRRLQAESNAARTSVERLEATATGISAVLLVVLSAYVLLTSVAGLALRVIPSSSITGVAVTAVAIAIMPWLARAKQRANTVLVSPALRADIAETVSCAYLAAVTLAGLAVAMLTGLWWVQYAAALALLIWLVPETLEALEARRHNGANQGGPGEDR